MTAAVLAACTGLKQADPPTDTDASLPEGDATAPLPDGSDASQKDPEPTKDSGPDATEAGALPDSPADTACPLATDAWAKTTKSAGCNDRKVFLLEGWTTNTLPFFARSVSIARAKNGRVGIAVNGETGVEEGSLRIRTFTPTTATFASTLVKIDPLPFENVGAAVRMTAGNDDTFHLVYQRDTSQAGGPVVYRKLPANNTFTAEQQFASVGHGTKLDISVSPTNSDVVASYFTPPTTTVAGKLESVLRPDATQKFDPPITVQGSFAKDGVIGSGEHVLRYDQTGGARIAFHLSQTFSSANPKFSELTGSWRAPKTIDNPTLDGAAGYSLGLVLFGQRKSAAYFYRKAGTTTAELRIGTWTLENDPVDVDTRDLGILAPDPTSPQYSLALGVDGLGLLHLAYTRPTSATKCSLVYARQTRKAGVVKWLEDGIAADLPCEDNSGVVLSIVVDDKGRPHIAYVVAAVGVLYATRFDR
jgi:hypothetical protein